MKKSRADKLADIERQGEEPKTITSRQQSWLDGVAATILKKPKGKVEAATVPSRRRMIREQSRKRLEETKKKLVKNLCVNTGQGSGGGFTACNTGAGAAAAQSYDLEPKKTGGMTVADASAVMDLMSNAGFDHGVGPGTWSVSPPFSKGSDAGQVQISYAPHNAENSAVIYFHMRAYEKKLKQERPDLEVVLHAPYGGDVFLRVSKAKTPPPTHTASIDGVTKVVGAPAAVDGIAPVQFSKGNDGRTGFVSMNAMEQIGGQGGSNPGGLFKDASSGRKWYIKTPQDEDRARNEMLAAKLYELGGIKAPKVALVPDHPSGKVGVASRIIDGLKADPAGLKAGTVKGVKRGFAMDAWLANWDVVGMTFDNMLVTEKGEAVRLDTGGAMRYRAQGSAKGSAFGKTVGELTTMRDPNKGAGRVFHKMTNAEVQKSVASVLQIPKRDIVRAVRQWGPKDAKENQNLLDTLLARRQDMAKQVSLDFLEARNILIRNMLIEAGLPADLLERRKKIKGNLCVQTGTGSGGGFVPCDKGGSGRVDKVSHLAKRAQTAAKMRDLRNKLKDALKNNDPAGVKSAMQGLAKFSQTKNQVHLGNTKSSISGFLNSNPATQTAVVAAISAKLRKEAAAKNRPIELAPAPAKPGEKKAATPTPTATKPVKAKKTAEEKAAAAKAKETKSALAQKAKNDKAEVDKLVASGKLTEKQAKVMLAFQKKIDAQNADMTATIPQLGHMAIAPGSKTTNVGTIVKTYENWKGAKKVLIQDASGYSKWHNADAVIGFAMGQGKDKTAPMPFAKTKGVTVIDPDYGKAIKLKTPNGIEHVVPKSHVTIKGDTANWHSLWVLNAKNITPDSGASNDSMLHGSQYSENSTANWKNMKGEVAKALKTTPKTSPSSSGTPSGPKTPHVWQQKAVKTGHTLLTDEEFAAATAFFSKSGDMGHQSTSALEQATTTWANTLSTAAKGAITKYTNGDFTGVNKALAQSGGQSGGLHHTQARRITAGVLKGNGNQPEHYVNYRGDRLRPEHIEAINQFMAGNKAVFTVTTILSTSTSHGTSTGFQNSSDQGSITMRIKSNGQGTFVKAASHLAWENEALYVPGHKLQVVGARKVKTHYDGKVDWEVDFVAIGFENTLLETFTAVWSMLEKEVEFAAAKITDYGKDPKPGESSWPSRISCEVPFRITIIKSDDPDERAAQDELAAEWAVANNAKV